MTSYANPQDRLCLRKLDQTDGALSIDEAFRDQDGKAVFSFAGRTWPHGWNDAAAPHRAIAAR